MEQHFNGAKGLFIDWLGHLGSQINCKWFYLNLKQPAGFMTTNYAASKI